MNTEAQGWFGTCWNGVFGGSGRTGFAAWVSGGGAEIPPGLSRLVVGAIWPG